MIKVPAIAESAYLAMKTFAENSLDFDDAQRLREERDGPLAARFPLAAPESSGNLYLMPNGTLVNADDPLYSPTVISTAPHQTFSDMPQRGDP